MPKKIFQKENPILRGIAKDVPIADIKLSRIKNVIKEMKSALAGEEDGVAIAAPQIGYSLRIFVVSKRVFEITKKVKDVALEKSVSAKDLIFINPKILKVSKERKVVEEGCLSVRYLYGKVSRARKATVVAYDENGQKFTRGGTGLLAQIFQHEIDHLDGILFIDKAKHVEEMIPEHLLKNKKIRNEK